MGEGEEFDMGRPTAKMIDYATNLIEEYKIYSILIMDKLMNKAKSRQ